MRIVAKTGWFWTTLNVLVWPFTRGRFMTDYATTIGIVIAVPPAWLYRLDEPWLRYLLVHERHHIEQQRKAGLGSVWLGLIPWGLVWLFFPLPIGFAWGRYLIERSAYVAGFMAELANTSTVDREARRIKLIELGVEMMTKRHYGWCWPFPAAVRRYFEREI